MTKINQTNFKKAMENSGGNKSRIAERLGCSRQAVYDYLAKNPQLIAEVEDEAEKIIDVAEDNITTAIIVHHDLKASKWILLNSKRGRARGYGKGPITEPSKKINPTELMDIYEEVYGESKSKS